ncbi:MAG: CoA transferase [Nitriliruptoraceae bacterium]
MSAHVPSTAATGTERAPASAPLAAFAGLRIVEVTSDRSAGALTGRMLAQLGAGCERIDAGSAAAGATVDEPPDEVASWRAALAMMYGAGKQLREPAALDDLDGLLSGADVLLVDDAGIRAMGGSKALDAALSRFPELICCPVTAVGGHDGAGGDTATELTVEAAAGVLGTTGHSLEETVRAGFPVGDIIAALNAVSGTLAALIRRQRTGEGTRVDTSVFDGLFFFLGTFMAKWLAAGIEPQPVGNRHPVIGPWNDYPTSDGSVVICVATDAAWGRLCELLGTGEDREDWPGWSNNERVARQDEIDVWISEWTRTRTSDDVLSQVDQLGVPCSRLQSLAEVLDSQQTRARGLIEEAANGASIARLPFRLRRL